MANLRTSLRELSFIYGLIAHDFSVPKFKDFCSTLADNGIEHGLESKDSVFYSKVVFDQIVKNGIRLGIFVKDNLKITKIDTLNWTGNDTQSDTPYDVIVNNIPISLKEDSFILENMGLYKLLSLLTENTYKRGEVHIFKKFAPREYEEWFDVAWHSMFYKIRRHGPWVYKGKGYTSTIKEQDNKIVFIYKSPEKTLSCSLPFKSYVSLDEFEKETNSILREKVFSKWISSIGAYVGEYKVYKNICSTKAGEELTKFIRENIKVESFSRIFRILETPYYYAKVTNNSMELYKVPGKQDFKNNFEIMAFEYSVPSSQLNLLTTIKNIKLGTEITFRNELRFSHGQFNGTPEAKLYYTKDSSLEAIYELVATQ